MERYRILERLGEGGLGTVYRAEDLATQEIRALKIMPRAAGRAHLRGEFLALARLHHDNIVRVFDFGTTPEGEDFFTMELVRGRDLKTAAPPPTSESFYPLIGGVARALAFLHARGMVHADIKPSNILVDEELLASEPSRAGKLVDFGLAAPLADPQGASARGTFSYAAPEVYAGRLDARSDLYSLGVVLYEIATGQQPFGTGDVAEVIRGQRQGPPPDPRTIRSDLATGLCELILALTEPEPAARLQSADEVLSRINDLGGTKFDLTGDQRPQIDLGGTLVGRDRDLNDLLSLWEKAREGHGAAVLISGETGIGKSRLLSELRLSVQLQGGKFYGARAATRSDFAHAAVGDLLRRLFSEVEPSHAQRIAPRKEQVLALLGKSPVGPADADPSSRFALAETLAALVLELSAIQPIVIAFDDVHEADAGTISLLAYLARAIPSGRVLLALGATTDVEGQGLAPLLGSLATSMLRRVDLPPLDRGSVRTLLNQLFGSDIGDSLVSAVHRASGGNPALIERALASLIEQGVLLRQRGAWVLTDRASELRLDSVPLSTNGRLGALPAETRQLLEAASVLGERFDLDLLGEVTGDRVDHERLLTTLAPALAAHVLEWEAEGEALQFQQPAVARRLYAQVEESTRARLHRAASRVLERRAKTGTSIPPAALARHSLAVGDVKRGLGFALSAADERLAAHDFHGALAWLARADSLMAEARGHDANLVTVTCERLADLRATLGDASQSESDYRRALRLAPDPLPRARITRKLAELLRRRGDSGEALALLMKGLAQARQEKLQREEAAFHFALARVCMYRAEYPAAVEHSTCGLALARAAGDKDLGALLIKTRADVETFRGEPRVALVHLDGALADVAGLGDLTRADVHHTHGHACIHAGDYARAIDSLDQAIAVYRKLGRVEQEAKSVNNLGAACYFQGEWDRAHGAWERFRTLCERIDDSQELVMALNNLGSLHRDRGEFREALALLERGRAIAEKIGRLHAVGLVLGNRGETLMRQGDLPAARDLYDRCLQLFKSLGAREDEIETRRRLCELEIAVGHVDVALDQAIDAAREARLAGARLEEGALHRVAANALRLQGDLESAAWFVERAHAIVTSLGARYEQAKVDMELTELALTWTRPSDAEDHLDRAIESFAALGARWDLLRARERKRVLFPDADKLGGSRSSHFLARGGLEVLLEVARASGRMDLEKLLEIVLDKILEVTRFERGFILLLDERGRPTERMRRTRARDARDFDRTDVDFSGSIVRRVIQNGDPVAVTDVADDAALREQKSVMALGLRSVMCAPMRLKGQITGIVYVDSRRLSEVSGPADLPLLEALASQAAIAIENARLVAEEQRKSELLTVLAHEVRNPLSGILGYSDILPEEKAHVSATALDLLSRIHRDAERLKRLVDNVLELARVEGGKVNWPMMPLNVAELLGEARSTYEAVASRKGIALVVSAPPDLPRALGNPDRLFQVLSNLVGNALKLTERGSITLAARAELRTEIEKLEPQHGGLKDSDWVPLPLVGGDKDMLVRIDVVDTGPGIPSAQLQRLFEKFAQGEQGVRSSRGMGLGLFLSREIVQRHGGMIWVQSEPGKGTCFSLRIPAAAG
ncbi:MAG: tetratricopeptide repeat protein [Deltaproteobacteria bacterium]|nr:tetratricopeptide repeat protein [Deltaproteobacteria bacterium]